MKSRFWCRVAAILDSEKDKMMFIKNNKNYGKINKNDYKQKLQRSRPESPD